MIDYRRLRQLYSLARAHLVEVEDQFAVLSLRALDGCGRLQRVLVDLKTRGHAHLLYSHATLPARQPPETIIIIVSSSSTWFT